MFFSRAPNLTIFCNDDIRKVSRFFCNVNCCIYQLFSTLIGIWLTTTKDFWSHVFSEPWCWMIWLSNDTSLWWDQSYYSRLFGPLHPRVMWTAFECLDLKNFPQKLQGIETPSKCSTSMWSLTWVCCPSFPQALQIYTGIPGLLFSKLFAIIELTCSSSFFI